MTQATVSLSFTDAQLSAIDAALAELETQFSALIGLTNDERRALTKMGSKSETFCRQTMSLLAQNPQLVPASLPLATSQQLLGAMDQLRPRMSRSWPPSEYFHLLPAYCRVCIASVWKYISG